MVTKGKIDYDDCRAATDKDFEQMLQILIGFCITQIAGAVASYSIADYLARGLATVDEIGSFPTLTRTVIGLDEGNPDVDYQTGNTMSAGNRIERMMAL